MSSDRQQNWSRRRFLKASGVTLALPLLDAFAPRVQGNVVSAPPRRFLGICHSLGFYAPNLFPVKAGRDYELTPYLKLIERHRERFTICSGVSHPEVDGGHFSEASFLTTAPHPKSSSFKNTISLDQYIVERTAPATRFPFLALATARGTMSWTSGGVPIPSENSPSAVFKKLFVEGTPEEAAEQVHKLDTGRSVLDAVLEQTRRMHKSLDAGDRDKLDQYMTAVRDVEGRLQSAQAWVKRSKPKVDAPIPADNPIEADVTGRGRLLFDLVQLAFSTDSTRVVTISMDAAGPGLHPLPGVKTGHHNLSHHGLDDAKLAELRLIEEAQMHMYGHLLDKLHGATEQGGTLLDRTAVVFGSNLGNASSHDTRNMPIFLAGGGFRHGQHLSFDRTNNYPLANAYVSILQRMGIETDRFGSASATMRGLEPTTDT
ncbi:MAG: DUF1552 domain-containing protein [Planctomycetales bacterium]|nr:DUF1552 domain-containing protein [Planctomycetales bacterium]MBN8628112.1 DUF1552 domain-containing protein [Planctomycetota bacterium]